MAMIRIKQLNDHKQRMCEKEGQRIKLMHTTASALRAFRVWIFLVKLICNSTTMIYLFCYLAPGTNSGQ